MFQYFVLTIYRVLATSIAFRLGSKWKDKSKYVIGMILVGIIFGFVLFEKVE